MEAGRLNGRNHFATGIKTTGDKTSNFFKKGFESLKGLVQTKEEKHRIEMQTNAGLISTQIARFVDYFIHMTLPYE